MVRETRMCLASFACLQPKIGRTLLTLTTPWPSYQIHQGSTHNLQRHFITTCPLLRSFSKIQHCLRPDESGSQFLFPILLRTFFASFKELKQGRGLGSAMFVLSCLVLFLHLQWIALILLVALLAIVPNMFLDDWWLRLIPTWSALSSSSVETSREPNGTRVRTKKVCFGCLEIRIFTVQVCQ